MLFADQAQRRHDRITLPPNLPNTIQHTFSQHPRHSWLTIGFVVCLMLLPCLQGVADEPDRHPNIVFIMADDLGWQDVGYAGARFFETPHIDRLAASGMKFTAACSGGPNCSPTRACLMSGTYTPRHQIYTPAGRSKGDPRYMKLLVPARQRKAGSLAQLAARQFRIANQLSPEFVCVPEVLKPQGYATARIGKWHLGPDNQGFDLHTADGQNNGEGRFYGNVDVAAQLTDRTIQFMEQHQEQPFFVYLCHWDVHTPHRARNKVVQRYREKLSDIPPDQRGNLNPVYAGMIEAVDRSVGRVVEAVNRLGLSDNTLIVFTSDNGGLSRVSQLEPLRGEKGSLFEAGVRVPACMAWPGRITAGTVCDTPLTSVDYLPTFAELAGAPLPTAQPVDGVSLVPLLSGNKIEERTIFWHYPLYLQGRGLSFEVPGGDTYSWRGFPSTTARRGHWKAVHFHETDHVALYDLNHDPGETRDVSSVQTQLTANLRQQIEDWQHSVGAPVVRTRNPKSVLD